jgi:hypothetical protein
MWYAKSIKDVNVTFWVAPDKSRCSAYEIYVPQSEIDKGQLEISGLNRKLMSDWIGVCEDVFPWLFDSLLGIDLWIHSLSRSGRSCVHEAISKTSLWSFQRTGFTVYVVKGSSICQLEMRFCFVRGLFNHFPFLNLSQFHFGFFWQISNSDRIPFKKVIESSQKVDLDEAAKQRNWRCFGAKLWRMWHYYWHWIHKLH